MKWRTVNLKNYIKTIESGKREKGGAIEEGIPSLGAEHINNWGGFNIGKGKLKYISESFFNSMKSGVIRTNDIIIVKDGATTGKVAIIRRDFPLKKAAVNEHVFILRPDTNFLPEFLFYYLFSDIGQKLILQDFRGATVGGISKDFININIPYPPIEIQQKIADILDKASELINKRKKQIELLDRFVKSVFIDMFGDPVTNPKGWEECQFEKCIIFMTSGSRGWSQYFSDSGNLFLTIKNVKHGRLILSNVQYVNPPNNKETQRTKVQKEDLLISITADLGRTAVVDKDTAEAGAYINQHLCLLRLDSTKISPIYTAAFLESEGGKVQFRQKDQTGVKSGLNFEAIKSLNILIPPINLQNQFAAIVEQTEKQKELLSSGLEKLELTYKSLMQKAFSGELFN